MAARRPSVTFTALIFFGMAIALAGVVLLLLGAGGAASFELALGGVTLKTTSVGLAVIGIGAALSAGVAMNLPDNVQVFSRTAPTMAERLRALRPVFVGLALLALLGFVLSLLL